ncbi:MAG TPA: restriction endonuclease [Noviherbaspirillum sp.]|uniref:restriction endonuclease n=1 Tax=Noviherbaspirillum sp. TaxID=1926288 RepID=UPI002F9450EB
MRMAENSLFAILLRKPWWISILLAGVVALAMAAVLPRDFAPYGASGAFPFLVIGIIAAVRQWRVPNAATVTRTLDALRAMPWNAFAAAVEQAYRRQGYEVRRLDGAADFAVVKAGRSTLVSARRWKAASTGVEPLRELLAAVDREHAQDAACLSLGGASGAALQFAQQNRIRVVSGAELALLMQGVTSPRT